MSEKLIATKGMTYGGKWLNVGDPFEAEPKFARVLKAVGKASAPKPAKVPAKVEPESAKEPEKPAEPVADTPAEAPEPAIESKDLTAEDKTVGSVKGAYGRKDMRAK